MCFVTTLEEVFGEDGRLTTSETRTQVYREPADPNMPPPQPQGAPAAAEWSRTIHPSSVLLFRYSALTMNSHKIHFDKDYVRDVEGYPGLLVHGPLTMTLMLDLFRRKMPKARIASLICARSRQFTIQWISQCMGRQRMTEHVNCGR